MNGLNVGAPIFASGILTRHATGDFANYLAQYPNTARAKLERYVLIQYDASVTNLTNFAAAKASLAADPYVVAVYEPDKLAFLIEPSPTPITPLKSRAKSVFDQYHLGVLKLPEAWTYAGGWGFVSVADNGLYLEHQDLKSFSGPGSVGGTFIPGGNFLPKYAFDVGMRPIGADLNVDEIQPVVASANTQAEADICDEADDVDDNMMAPAFAGHGTHVSGLISANHNSASGIKGACKNCGLMMMKISSTVCVTSDFGQTFVTIDFGPFSVTDAINTASELGAQAINTSFRTTTDPATPITDYCGTNPNHPTCLALQFARENEVIISAASGNGRSRLDYPARAKAVSGVGGIDADLTPWDESPGTATNCPYGTDFECGTNYTKFSSEKRQEVVAPAKAVRSSIYPGKDWNAVVACGDSYGDDFPGDGVGLCTGTSMSAPQLTAIYGLLRSINPLLLAGDPETAAYGIRDVVTTTTDRAQASLPWDSKLGYGIPDVPAAARKILGTVRDSIAKNRATPLFALYGPTTTDYAVMATPQNAMTLIRYASERVNNFETRFYLIKCIFTC